MEFVQWKQEIDRLLIENNSLRRTSMLVEAGLREDWQAGLSPSEAHRKILAMGDDAYQAHTADDPAAPAWWPFGKPVPAVDVGWLANLHVMFTALAWVTWIVGAIFAALAAIAELSGPRITWSTPNPVEVGAIPIEVQVSIFVGKLLSLIAIVGLGAFWLFLAHTIRWMAAPYASRESN